MKFIGEHEVSTRDLFNNIRWERVSVYLLDDKEKFDIWTLNAQDVGKIYYINEIEFKIEPEEIIKLKRNKTVKNIIQ